MIALAVVEAVILYPGNIGPAFISDWGRNLEGSKLELLPPALIGLLMAYGKWVQQSRAVDVGVILLAAIGPVAAMAVIEIDDGPTFWTVLVCIGISVAAVAGRVPWNSRLHRANIALVSFGVFGAITLNIPDAIEPDVVEKTIHRFFIWTTIVALVVTVGLYFFVNVRRSLVWAVYFGSSIATVLLLWVIILEQIHTNYPVVGKILVYVLLTFLGLIPVAYLVVRDKLKKPKSPINP